MKYFILQYACSLMITCNLVSADLVPAMLWNIKGNALHIKPVSALGHNDKVLSDNLKDILHQGSSLLVFAINKLSLEDFSASEKPAGLNNTLYNIESFLDLQPYMLLPSVKDPLNHIHKAHCGVQEIVVDNKIDDAVIQAVSNAYLQSCVVILHISDDGILPKEDHLKKVFLPAIDGSNKNIVGAFTGVKSSWGSPDSERHVSRNLLAASVQKENFVNISGCIIMYAENATIKIGTEGNNSITLPFPVDTEGSVCNNESERILQLNFKTEGSPVTIRLNFDKKRSAWLTNGTLITQGIEEIPDELDLNTETVGAPLGFSYSCGNLVLKPKNTSYAVKIFVDGFQIQPYEIKHVFSDSFDCVPYFTIPIWMGAFVSILFIVILNIGIYALFSVHTMDRFDDPKGKTISVAAAASND